VHVVPELGHHAVLPVHEPGLLGDVDDVGRFGHLRSLHQLASLRNAEPGWNCPVPAVTPPSAGTTTPVTKLARGEARNAMTWATSAGSPQRPSGPGGRSDS